MFRQVRPALVLLALFTLLTGVVYPLAVTGSAQVLFSRAANGSLIEKEGKAIGSSLIGQSFSDLRYFWSRPSATNPAPYTAFESKGPNGSSGSNLGPLNPALLDAVRDRAAALRAADPDNDAPIPVDLVTASASGLDPQISPAAAAYQVRRVARVRQLDEERVRLLVAECTEDRFLGILGEPRVNVLRLNLALDGLGP